MKSRMLLVTLVLLAVVSTLGWTYWNLADADPGADMTATAHAYLGSLDDAQRVKSQLKYDDTQQRVGWHFIPKNDRKGLQIRDMNDEQRKAALALLRASLSEVGYDKATKIMTLETILHELEKSKPGGNIRDPERYYFTVFGEPTAESRWGLSVEGHHLSLNFVVDNNHVISSTPTFFGANPATVKNDVPGGPEQGTRVLAKEEQLAFDLLNSLSQEQRSHAVIADQAPAEIRAAGEPQPPLTEPEGISYGDLEDGQQETMRQLVNAYARNLPAEIAKQRIQAIVQGGAENVRFAWAGAVKPGVGHYYRIQGSTFLIEFVNTQPDAAGNPANHIHCVWRDRAGDFAIPIATGS